LNLWFPFIRGFSPKGTLLKFHCFFNSIFPLPAFFPLRIPRSVSQKRVHIQSFFHRHCASRSFVLAFYLFLHWFLFFLYLCSFHLAILFCLLSHELPSKNGFSLVKAPVWVLWSTEGRLTHPCFWFCAPPVLSTSKGFFFLTERRVAVFRRIRAGSCAS